jgi:hypothetical protein
MFEHDYNLSNKKEDNHMRLWTALDPLVQKLSKYTCSYKHKIINYHKMCPHLIIFSESNPANELKKIIKGYILMSLIFEGEKKKMPKKKTCHIVGSNVIIDGNNAVSQFSRDSCICVVFK